MRFVQKLVPATSIIEGDVIFQTMPEHGDVAMHVRSVSRSVARDGRDVCVYQGDIYKLSGQGSGESPIFRGDIGGGPFAPGEGGVTTRKTNKKEKSINQGHFQ